MAGFLCHSRVEYDLELQVAELIGEGLHIAAGDGVGNLVRFLDRIGSDGREALFAIPLAAKCGVSKAAHNGDEAAEISQSRGFCQIF